MQWSALGIGPHQIMQSAERFYLSVYLSHPRTESTAYPNLFDIRSALKMLASDNRWGSYVNESLKNGNFKPQNKRRGWHGRWVSKSRAVHFEVGLHEVNSTIVANHYLHEDHPPITPCRAASPHELSGDMARVYELVTRHFIRSDSQDDVHWCSRRQE